MDIRAMLTEPPKRVHPGYQYGMLLFTLALLVWYVWWRIEFAGFHTSDPYIGGVVILMMLLNHLAFTFRWSAAVTAALRVTSVSWTVLGLVYVVILSRFLYAQ